MKIFLAGATGVIGRQLLPRLISDGHQVFAMTRSTSQVGQLEALGAKPVVCDVFNKDQLFKVVGEFQPDVIVHQLTNIPFRINPSKVMKDLAQTNKLRTEGTKLLIEAAKSAGVNRFVAQSVAFYYEPTKSEYAGEEEPLYENAHPSFSEIIEAIKALEELTLSTNGINGLVLRYGYFYGPGTTYALEGSFAEDVSKGRVPMVGNGDATFSFVHVADAAAATALAIKKNATGIFNVVDDDPVKYHKWLPAYADLIGAPKPKRVPKLIGRMAAGPFGVYFMNEQRGASNLKIKKELGWEPMYPNTHDGFTSDLRLAEDLKKSASQKSVMTLN